MKPQLLPYCARSYDSRTANAAARAAVLALALLLLATTKARGQDVDVLVFSTEPGGGTLVPAGYDFAEKVRVRDRLGFCPGGQCFYSSTNPGYRTASGSRPDEGLHALADGTPVSFEVVAIDSGVSVKWGPTILDSAGESTRIGTALALHVHPEYQLQAAEGVVGDFGVSFRLTSSSPLYGASDVFRFTLTNGDSANTPTQPPSSPTATPSPTAIPTNTPVATPTHTALPTATPTNSATPTNTVPPNDTCDGDCDGNGAVSIAELIRGVNIALGNLAVTTCSPFDIDGNGAVAINELISAVRDALEGC